MAPPKFNQMVNNKTGKLKKIPTVASPAPATAPARVATEDEGLQQLELEICWCVQQLEISLQAKNLTKKQVEDIEKSIRILKSGTQPTVKKRQLMRNTFGDYRAKMQEEERRLAASAGRVQFKALPGTSKSQFLRKAIIKPSGEEFRFNFQVDQLSLDDKSNGDEGGAAKEIPPPVVNSFNYKPSDNSFRFNFGTENQ